MLYIEDGRAETTEKQTDVLAENLAQPRSSNWQRSSRMVKAERCERIYAA